ncbi:MAG: 3-methylornithine--L-lysine ligase PylC [Candidatus Adiutrix sp.]
MPACEDLPTLQCLFNWGRLSGQPVAFDLPSYLVSRDKAASKKLFSQAQIPTPLSYPQAQYPLICKPVDSSGSRGVSLLTSEVEFQHKFPNGCTHGWIIEEYCPGASYSLEITGRDGQYSTWLTTALVMDSGYDCRKVYAPASLSEADELSLKNMGLKIAQKLNLCGLMDIEVIKTSEGLKVLEIDARLPSQTPTVVYWATGENLLRRLAENFCHIPPPPPSPPLRAVIYKHVAMGPQGLAFLGEHIMAKADNLSVRENFFGADLAVTNYAQGCRDWVATIIVMEKLLEEAYVRLDHVLNNIKRSMAI